MKPKLESRLLGEISIISQIISDVEHLSMCLFAISVSSLEKCLFRYSGCFLIRVFFLYCMFSLYNLDINPLLIVFGNMFFHSVVCFFILLLVSFAVEKDFSLMESYLFIFALVTLAGGNRHPKILLRPMSRSILLR